MEENYYLNNVKLLPLYFGKAKSELCQDLFVLTQLLYRRNGYFVEFGATDGLTLSNTHILEKHFEWSGILAEPARCWHEALFKNRSCNIETSCVWKESNINLTFNEVDIKELSTISKYSNRDLHSIFRKKHISYEVVTISLNDLLEKYDSPDHIDYLSIDTEGSEYDILSNFNFSKYNFNIITVEHNYAPIREQLYELLSHYGYRRVCENFSKHDDWYIGSMLQ